MSPDQVRTNAGGVLPTVTCPGCQIAMTPVQKHPVPPEGMVEVLYRCDKCGTETSRTIKDD